jgi:hypothetical protein
MRVGLGGQEAELAPCEPGLVLSRALACRRREAEDLECDFAPFEEIPGPKDGTRAASSQRFEDLVATTSSKALQRLPSDAAKCSVIES